MLLGILNRTMGKSRIGGTPFTFFKKSRPNVGCDVAFDSCFQDSVKRAKKYQFHGLLAVPFRV